MDDLDVRFSRLAREKRARGYKRATAKYEPAYIEPDATPYMQAYEHKICLIDDILEEYLRVPLLYAEAKFGATLIYNDYEGPIWSLGKGRQGKSETKRAIDTLSAALRVLNCEADEVSRLGDLIDVSPFRRQLTASLAEMPKPANLMFDIDLLGATRGSLISLISAYQTVLQRQARQQKGQKSLAFRAALALRATYEHYTGKPVKSGKYRENGTTIVTGVFCRCLEEIYEVIEIEPDVYSKASWAKKVPETDANLRRYRSALNANSSYYDEFPLLFSKVGWVENMTNEQKQINSIAMNDKRLEHLLCYTKCSTETVSMTMMTTS